MKAKKIIAFLLAAVMVLSLSVTAFAENSDGESYTKGSIEIKNPQDNETYKAYKIFDVTYDLGSDGPADDKYAYTIATEWVNDVIGYTEATADANGVYTGKGLKITPVKNTSGTVVCYNVVRVQDDIATTGVNEDTFSAPDFGEKMAEKTSGKTAIEPTSGTARFENLDLGYYMVQPTTANSLVSLTTTDKDVKVSDKNEKPEVDKKLVGEDPLTTLTCTKLVEGSEDYDASHTHGETCYKEEEKEYTTKSVGDKVEFELDTKVPDMTGYDPYFFVVNDTLSKGLTYNEDVVITIGGKDQTEKTLVKDTDYSVKVVNNPDGSTNLRIVFNNMKNYWSDEEEDDWAGEPIVIEYSATVDEDAVMGTDGNSNTAKVEYSNNPNVVPQYDPETPPEDPNDPKDPKYKHNVPESGVKDPTGISEEDKVVVYTAELDLTKVDAATAEALTGAKFKIEGEKMTVSIVNKTIFEEDTNGTWYRLKDGTYTEESPDKNGENKTTYAEETVANPVTFTELTGADAVKGEGLYYSVDGGANKILITLDNLDTVPNDAKIYQPTYNTVGLFYKDGDNYVEITKANAAEHTTGTFYKATVWKQSDLYEDTTKKYKKVEVIDKNNASESFEAEGWVDEDGKITFGGLSEGTYYITELVAPDGYNLLKDPIKVEVELVAGDTAGSYKFQITIDDADTPVSEVDGVLSFNVENNQGIELPETGGIGTTIFYVIGAILVLGAAILLIVKRRMGARS